MSPKSVALPYSSSAKTARTTEPGASTRFGECDHLEDESSYESPTPDEPQPLGQLLEEATRRRGLRMALLPGDEGRDERGRHEEASPRRSRALWSRRTEQRELLPAELRRASSPAGSRPGSPTPAPYEHLRRARRRRGRAQPVPSRRSVEQRTGEHQCHQLPHLDSDRRVQQAGSRRRHWRPRGRRQRRTPKTEPDDYAAEESEDDCGGR